MSIKWLFPALLACASCAADGPANLDEGEWLPGGDTTNTLLFGGGALSLPAANITPEHELAFFTGNSFFNNPWVTAPASTESRDGLGPLFNARSCSACHFKDGRGEPPNSPEENFEGLLLRISIPGVAENGGTVPEPSYGGQIQNHGIDGVPAEARPSVSYEEFSGTYPDGTTYTLRRPTYTLSELAYGPLDPEVMISPRVASGMVGLGLLEAISEERLEELSDPDDLDGDGISGRINRVWDAEARATVVGRFGWKAEQPTVRQQVAGAFLGDVGITSPVFGEENCTSVQLECRNAPLGGEQNIEELLLSRVVNYSFLLAVPARQEYDSDEVLHGKALFFEIGCESCHTANHRTSTIEEFPEVSQQDIWPYTDLLLHDMGDDLSDNRPSFLADGNEWRTPPLWALRLYPVVNGHDTLLHDGRARGVEEAILWHGGESAASRDAFMELSKLDRDALIRFVESL